MSGPTGEAQDACPYANICEQCDNFIPAPEFAPALRDQLADVEALRADAQQRGWTSEKQRHQRVANTSTGTSASSPNRRALLTELSLAPDPVAG